MPLRLARPHAQWNGDWLPGTVRSRLNVIRDSGCHPRFRTTPFRRLQHGYDPLDVNTQPPHVPPPTCRKAAQSRVSSGNNGSGERSGWGPWAARTDAACSALVTRDLHRRRPDPPSLPGGGSRVDDPLVRPIGTAVRDAVPPGPDGVYAGTIEPTSKDRFATCPRVRVE